VFDDAGDSIDAVEIPGDNPTNVAFDPGGELGLVVTEADRGELLSFPDLGSGSSRVPFRG
jgi:gluconolactonase